MSANESDEVKQIIYKISHDMAAPIRQANSFSGLLVSTYGDELNSEAKKWLSYISDSTEKAQTMLTKLLEYSRLSSDVANRDELNLNEIWSKVMTQHNALFAENEVVVNVGELPMITGDKNHWIRVFISLFHNSLLFQKPNQTPNIKVESKRISSTHSEITFEDNGIGVEEEFFSQITDIFRRLHIDDEYPGVGMGLSFCEAILKLYDGDIGFTKSELGGLKVIMRFSHL